MCAWKSRWSCDRFVKPAAWKTTPSTRWSTSACEVTSIATWVTPFATISAKSLCRSSDSGVVRAPDFTRSPTRVSIVPISPVVFPAARRIDSSRNAVVVFPLVPVTPRIRKRCAGEPKKPAAIRAIARRTSVTTSCGTSSGWRCCTQSAAAPWRTAAAANRWPSVVAPGTQKNRSPGARLLES